MSAVTVQDRVVLQRWLRTGASLADVEGTERYGLVDNERFSPAALRAFRLVWAWRAQRFGGPAGRAQDRVYARCGREFLEARIARCRARVARLINEG